MATGLNLTWMEALDRWKKKRNGKVFYFKYPHTTEGYSQAWNAWLSKLEKLEAAEADTNVVAGKRRAKEHRAKAKYFDLVGRVADARNERATATGIESQIENGQFLEPPIGFNDTWGSPAKDLAEGIWQDRLNTVAKVYDPAHGKDLETAVQDFLNVKKNQAFAKAISPGRFDNLRRSLAVAVDELGNVPVAMIGEMSLTALYSGLIASDFGCDYAKNCFDIFKQFVTWAWQHRLIESLPRNMKSAEWKFVKKGATKKVRRVVKKDDIATILEKAPDKIKLWVLLGLNCGMTQVDIADLRADDVNWKSGRITRKRSKAETGANAPTVCYKLWDVTFKLLKQMGNRKGRVLTTRNGAPLRVSALRADGTLNKNDPLGLCFRRFLKAKMPGVSIEFKSFRKTGNTVLRSSELYRDLRHHYLGHAPRGMAEKHYDVEHPSFQPLFDKVIEYVGRELNVV